MIALPGGPRSSLPDPELTPGAWTDDPPHVVLSAGYVRKRRKNSQPLRELVYRRYGIPREQQPLYVLDHLVPLMLGGLDAEQNLWPHALGAEYNPRMKVRVEHHLRSLAVRGEIALEQAQEMLAMDWTAAYDFFLGGGR